MNKFVLDICETGREHLKAPGTSFNSFIEKFETKEELIAYLISRYGRMPNRRKKIYFDSFDKATLEKTTMECGFLYSYWNQDISHNSKKWFQTDWICYYEEDINHKYFKL